MGGLVFVSLAAPCVRLIILLWKKKRQGESVSNIEIRILKILIATILCYLIIIQLGGFITIGSYLEANHRAGETVTHNGVRNYSKWWWSLFYTVSAFQNAGFALFGSSIIPFAANRVVSLTIAFLVVSGYSLYPLLLRGILFLESKMFRGKNKEALEILLKDSRRFYYLLFPLKESLWVFGGFLAISFLEYVIFFVEWHQPGVYPSEDDGAGTKLMINFVQVILIRHCGMNNVNIGSLLLGHLSLIVVTMSISAFPFIVSVRSTRPDSQSKAKKVLKHIFLRDLFWIYLAILTICLVEQKRQSTDFNFIRDPYLSIVFEVSSAYGTVGLSLGVPDQNYSFSGTLSRFSKFAVICVMFAGRHRGIPDSVDPAVEVRERKSDIELKAA